MRRRGREADQQQREREARTRRVLLLGGGGAAILVVGLATVLNVVASNARERRAAEHAARLETERGLLAAARADLVARKQLIEGFAERFDPEAPLEPPKRASLDPAPQYPGNAMFVWFLRGTGRLPSIEDDRPLLARLIEHAEQAPEELWGPTLETSLAQALARHVVVAEVLALVEPGRIDYSAQLRSLKHNRWAPAEFEGGGCAIALRVLDTESGDVVAQQLVLARSSEDVEFEYDYGAQVGDRSYGGSGNEALRLDLARNVAGELKTSLMNLVGGNWVFAVR